MPVAIQWRCLLEYCIEFLAIQVNKKVFLKMRVSFSFVSKKTSEEERVKAFLLFFSLIGDYEQNKADYSRKIQWKEVSGRCIS